MAIDVIRKIQARLRANPPKTPQEARDEHMLMNALVWAAGGCINDYHPPECDGTTHKCRHGTWEQS